MGDFFIGLLNSIISGLATVINAILSILPPSPFQALDNSPIADYIGYVNWFIPVAEILVELAACCTAILIYYAYSIVMRWMKVIE